MEQNKNTISIGIIIFNNTKREIDLCLQSIFRQSYGIENIEIILKNQGCKKTNDIIHNLIKTHGWTNITYFDGDNVGFGSGHNSIFKRVSPNSKAYLCLNPDAILHPDCLLNMTTFADQIDWKGIFEPIQEPVMHPKYFNPKSKQTDWCSGACLLIPSYIYRLINGYDDDFFLYCEDVDLSWRVKAKGFNCFTCDNALLYHYAEDRASRLSEINLSKLILAHKWRSNNFKNKLLHTVAEEKDISMKDLEEYLKKIPQHTVEEVLKVKPDFKNDGVFSKPMR